VKEKEKLSDGYCIKVVALSYISFIHP